MGLWRCSLLLRRRAGLMRGVLVSYALVAIVLGATALAAAVLDRPAGDFLRDPVAVLGGPLSTGIVSTLGGAAWWAGGVVALFAGLVVSRVSGGASNGHALVFIGGLTALLALDDLLVLHERLEPYGLPESVLFAGYALSAAAWLARYRHFVPRTELVVLAAASGFFALSLLVDLFSEGKYLLEDGLKLFGIATWTLYLVRTSIHEVLECASGEPPTAPDGETAGARRPNPSTPPGRQRHAAPWPRR